VREISRYELDTRSATVREIASFLGSRWVTACDLQIGDREISRPARGGGVVRGEAGSGWLGVAGRAESERAVVKF
jgi:hypothetical protein